MLKRPCRGNVTAARHVRRSVCLTTSLTRAADAPFRSGVEVQRLGGLGFIQEAAGMVLS
jgi:hypothetical protein